MLKHCSAQPRLCVQRPVHLEVELELDGDLERLLGETAPGQQPRGLGDVVPGLFDRVACSLLLDRDLKTENGR